MEYVIAGISNPQFSVDLSKVYFQSVAWATSMAIHAVDIRTGKEKFICPGNDVKVIQSGKWKGDLVVLMHKYKGAPLYGSYDHYFIVDGNGKELKDMGEDYEELR
jgi:hypothetical protein